MFAELNLAVKVFNPCWHVVDAARDWGIVASAITTDLSEARQQPYRVAAVRVFYDRPDVFDYEPAIADIPLHEFDLVLISDPEYNRLPEILRWIQSKGVGSWLLALGGSREADQPDEACMVSRPYYIPRFLAKNQPQPTAAEHKPYRFDMMLGARRPHRDYACLAFATAGLLDTNIVTYRDCFPGALINHQTQEVQALFPNQQLAWPYVSPNLDPAWEVSAQINNQISFDAPWEIYRRCWYSVITETLGTGRDFFLSEKTIKALYCGRIFVVFAPQYFLRNLRELGFETWEGIVDESYDQEPLDYVRYQRAMLQIMRLAWLEDPRISYHRAQNRLEHNHLQLGTVVNQARRRMHQLIRSRVPSWVLLA